MQSTFQKGKQKMKAFREWSFERYQPAVHKSDDIYVERIVPSPNGFEIEHSHLSPCTLFFRVADSDADFCSVPSRNGKVGVSGIEPDQEYEFYLSDGADSFSEHGFVHTGYAPGTVVNYLSKRDSKYGFSGNYLCTPSLLCHPDGYMLASMDLYAPRGGQNLTLIFRSDDNGKTWHHLTELFPCYWGTLFLHQNDVYLLGTSTEYGDILIGKSTDGGKHWLLPTVIQRGSCNSAIPGWHKSSGHVVAYKGRLWCAYDYGAHTAGGHASALLSAPVESDLLDPFSWSITEPLSYNPAWKNACIGDTRGFLEGNVVIGKDGGLYNILRYSMDRGSPKFGLAGMLKATVSDPEASLQFEKFIPFPGNNSKFDIVYDEKEGRYWSIISRISDETCATHRNLLSLICSDDLSEWVTVKDLIDYTAYDPKQHGFQYVSFAICGDDIRFLCRTATNHANSFHDSNYITYHIIEKFRELRRQSAKQPMIHDKCCPEKSNKN